MVTTVTYDGATVLSKSTDAGYRCTSETFGNGLVLSISFGRQANLRPNDIFNEYGTEIENVSNFAAGCSDGVLFGQGHNLARLVHGSDTPWADTSSGYYTGGLLTGIGATAVATDGFGTGSAISRFGANFSLVGRSSRLFGTGAFRNGNGVLNNLNNNNFARLGWGRNPSGNYGFRLAVGPNRVPFGGRARQAYQYLRHVHY